MKTHKWEVSCELVDDPPAIFDAISPRIAAEQWALMRGNDVEDHPRAVVVGPLGEDGCMTFVFDLHAEVRWHGTRVAKP